jgi:hypothetical protein
VDTEHLKDDPRYSWNEIQEAVRATEEREAALRHKLQFGDIFVGSFIASTIAPWMWISMGGPLFGSIVSAVIATFYMVVLGNTRKWLQERKKKKKELQDDHNNNTNDSKTN